MVFSSLIFLFVFLPLTLALYWPGGITCRNVVLLVFSLLFYAWGEGYYLLLMLVSIGGNYLVGRFLRRGARQRRWLVAIGISFNLLLLIWFKYSNFLADTLNGLLDLKIHLQPVHLPIGISFFTFQALSYIIDVYQGKVESETSPLRLALYISSFPQLIAGPIVRYHDIARQLRQRSHSLDLFASGVGRFIIGLGKKVLIANDLADMADHIFPIPAEQLSTGEAWLGILCYSLQIYVDFSAYSDMAIGLGQMFGFHFPENFNYPYISKSIQEFWRRWHISLSTWFRDYLYIPLGGNRRGSLRTGCNLLLVFLLCGLWHGASWNFVVWGLIHGFFLALERNRVIRAGLERIGGWQHLYVLLVVALSWVFFRLERLPQAVSYLGALVGIGNTPETHPWVLYKMDHQIWLAILLGILASVPLVPALREYCTHLKTMWSTDHPVLAFGLGLSQAGLLVGILVLSLFSLASGAYNPFIYFRF